MPSVVTDISSSASTGAIHPMHPPRLPLHASNRGNAALSQLTMVNSSGEVVHSSTSAPKRSNRNLSPEDMTAFRHIVQDSNLTKTGLIEILKKRCEPVLAAELTPTY